MAQRAISFCNFKLTNSGSPCIGRPCLKRPPWAPRTWRDSPRGSGTPSTTLSRTGRSTSRLSRRLIAQWSNLVTNSGSEQLHDLAVGRRNQPATNRGSVFYRGNGAHTTSDGPASPSETRADDWLPATNAAIHAADGQSPTCEVIEPSARSRTTPQWAPTVRTP